MGGGIGTTVVVLVEEDDHSSNPPSEENNEVKSVSDHRFLDGETDIHREQDRGDEVPQKECKPDKALDGHPHADGSSARGSFVRAVDSHTSQNSEPNCLTNGLRESLASSSLSHFFGDL